MSEQYIIQQNQINVKTNLQGNFCTACELMFDTINLQKEHYKSELHQYNLKRRIVDLPPVSEEIFRNTLNQYKNEKNQDNSVKISQSQYCKICQKKFKSKPTFNQHLQSKKHLQKLEKGEIKVKQERTKLSDTTLYNLNICLFCNEKFESFTDNMQHMQLKHSFFILEEDYCTNKKKLLKQLSEKIFKQFECLYCDNEKSYKSFLDTQNHMLDKGHCMMNEQLLKELNDLYDYSKENNRILEKFFKKKDGGYTIDDQFLDQFEIVEVEDDQENDDWETISEEEDEEEFENIQSESIQTDNELLQPNKKYDLRKIMLMKAQRTNNGELKLPNNKLLGNKKFEIYYKQKYRERFDQNEMKQFLEYNKDLITDDKQQEELQVMPYDDMKNLYLKTIKIYNKKQNQKLKIQKEHNTKLQVRFIKRDNRLKLQTLQNHNKVLTKHFKIQNLQFG